jgi:hypothetical protein
MSNDPREDRDRVFADSGWGIKPDDQPANAADARDAEATRIYRYRADEPDVIRKILRAQRKGFNTANRARIEGVAAGRHDGRTVIIDINKDEFIIEGLTFGDANLIPLLQALGAAFSPPELKTMGPDSPPREYDMGRVWAWGAERTG